MRGAATLRSTRQAAQVRGGPEALTLTEHGGRDRADALPLDTVPATGASREHPDHHDGLSTVADLDAAILDAAQLPIPQAVYGPQR